MNHNARIRQPIDIKPRLIKIRPTPDEIKDGIEYYKGPTPIVGGNGQLELLLRSLKDQRRKERLAKMALHSEL